MSNKFYFFTIFLLFLTRIRIKFICQIKMLWLLEEKDVLWVFCNLAIELGTPFETWIAFNFHSFKLINERIGVNIALWLPWTLKKNKSYLGLKKIKIIDNYFEKTRPFMDFHCSKYWIWFFHFRLFRILVISQIVSLRATVFSTGLLSKLFQQI